TELSNQDHVTTLLCRPHLRSLRRCTVFDPLGAAARSRRDLSRWLIDRRRRGTRAKWPGWAPSPYADRPPARVEDASWRISYVGHASFLIQTAGLNILLDPVWSRRASPSRFIWPKRVVRTDTQTISMSVLCHGWQPHI